MNHFDRSMIGEQNDDQIDESMTRVENITIEVANVKTTDEHTGEQRWLWKAEIFTPERPDEPDETAVSGTRFDAVMKALEKRQEVGV